MYIWFYRWLQVWCCSFRLVFFLWLGGDIVYGNDDDYGDDDDDDDDGHDDDDDCGDDGDDDDDDDDCGDGDDDDDVDEDDDDDDDDDGHDDNDEDDDSNNDGQRAWTATGSGSLGSDWAYKYHQPLNRSNYRNGWRIPNKKKNGYLAHLYTQTARKKSATRTHELIYRRRVDARLVPRKPIRPRKPIGRQGPEQTQ